MIDTDKVKDGDTVVVNKNLTGLTKGQQLTARMATRHQVVAENGAGLHVIARGHLDPLPAEPDVMKHFDEAASYCSRQDHPAYTSQLRQILLDELHRDPVQRLEAEHGIHVRKTGGGYIGVEVTAGGTIHAWHRVPMNDSARRTDPVGDIRTYAKFDTAHACATAILAVLEGGE